MKLSYPFGFLLILILSFNSCIKTDDGETIDDQNNNNNIVDNQQITGYTAKEILSGDEFTSLVIELVYMDGFAPSNIAIEQMKLFLEGRIFKPDGITINLKPISPLGNSSYNINDIRAIEDNYRTQFNSEGQMAIWGIFLDGPSANDSSADIKFGSAYRNTSFAIFQKSIQELSNNSTDPEQSLTESTVIQHQFCHLLGLTNLGSPMQSEHEDQLHPRHCDVSDCLNYYKLGTDAVLDVLSGRITPPTLDFQCLADLQANGGR
ncbi:MAG: membrane metalloprotease [Bacteroidia bacterium]|nr:membrane metalloprotease [Bacteroidia bacterium]